MLLLSLKKKIFLKKSHFCLGIIILLDPLRLSFTNGEEEKEWSPLPLPTSPALPPPLQYYALNLSIFCTISEKINFDSYYARTYFVSIYLKINIVINTLTCNTLISFWDISCKTSSDHFISSQTFWVIVAVCFFGC